MWNTKPIANDMFLQQQVKHPKWTNKIAVSVKHSKTHQGVIIDMNVNVDTMIIMMSLTHIKKNGSSPLRMRFVVLLATWRKTMLIGINQDKNKRKLPKLVMRINNLLLVLNRANNTSKLPELVVKIKFLHQTWHL